MSIARLHVFLQGKLTAWLVAGYLAALLQPAAANLWHEVDHLYNLARAEADHSYADHVHAYDFHEHEGALQIMLRLLVQGYSGNAPAADALLMQCELTIHLLDRVAQKPDILLLNRRYFALPELKPANFETANLNPPPEGDANITITMELC